MNPKEISEYKIHCRDNHQAIESQKIKAGQDLRVYPARPPYYTSWLQFLLFFSQEEEELEAELRRGWFSPPREGLDHFTRLLFA